MNDKCEAIAWLANIKEKYIHGGDEEFDECRRESIDMAIKALRQPQIVRCKDCEYYDSFSQECRNGIDGIMTPNFYCGNAERKEGR